LEQHRRVTVTELVRKCFKARCVHLAGTKNPFNCRLNSVSRHSSLHMLSHNWAQEYTVCRKILCRF